MTDLRLATEYAEVLADLPTPTLRLAGVNAEALTNLVTPTLLLAQTYVEVLTDVQPAAPVVKFQRIGRTGIVRSTLW